MVNIVNRDLFSFKGWHEDFQGGRGALLLRLRPVQGMSLERVPAWELAYRWTVQSRQKCEMGCGYGTGLFFFPFWTKKEVRYLQNHLNTSNQEGVPKHSIQPFVGADSTRRHIVCIRNAAPPRRASQLNC